jgi:hypothetical protein
MSNVKFSALPNQPTLTDATIIPTVASLTNYSANLLALKTYMATSGPQGTTGSQGTAGVQGTSGVNGAQGTTGVQGTAGVQGTQGTTGTFSGNLTANIDGQGYSILNVDQIDATGNITGSYFLGNGSQLTGILANSTYDDTNVATFLSSFGSNTIVTTGNITGGNVIVTFESSTTGNVTGGNLRSLGQITTVGNVTGGNLSAVGNITGSYVLANAALATGVVTLTGAQTIAGNKAFANTTTLSTYIETTVASVNTGVAYTPVFSTGAVQQITATANFALNAPTGMSAGSSITLVITQDATGSRVMTPNGAYRFAYGVKTLSTAANSVDVMSIFYTGTQFLCNLVKGYVP